ncbi:transmembrane protein 220 isoform X2 [Hypanus sabinus]|uniref:transmembrane protein 220 isoform X2 n=1 Tax=Hypanus sabinus TaxID=79690 RepID=UPI0028C3C0BF|nr:transmembrane protein 220 isoform X2 [Hypanus sabinus]
MDVHSGRNFSTSSPPRFYLETWRVCNICMAFFFALAAYVQINDPDAGIWTVVYLIPAVLSFLVGLNPLVTDNFIWKHLSLMHMSMCFMVATLWGWYLHRHAKNTIFHEEEGREFLGLVIIIIWMLLCQNSGKYLGGFKISIAVFITVLPFVTWLYYYINKELRASWPEHCKNTI